MIKIKKLIDGGYIDPQEAVVPLLRVLYPNELTGSIDEESEIDSKAAFLLVLYTLIKQLTKRSTKRLI